MHTGWVRRLFAGAAVGTAGLVIALPGVAMAGGGASGSAEPSTVNTGDDVNFFIQCEGSSSTASLTGTSLGLPSNIAMDEITDTEFDLDLTMPKSASRGSHKVSMQCEDGSFTTVTVVITPHGGADTGDGAMSGGASSVAIALGGLLVVGAGAGGFLLHRRRTAPVR